MGYLVKAMMLVMLAKPLFASRLDHARAMFRHGNFAQSIAALGSDISSKEAKWLKAESLFRLGQLREALALYKSLSLKESDSLQAQKAYLRIFECELRLRDLPKVIKSFIDYQQRYKIIPERMSYAMGKFLYDTGYVKHATQILKRIPLNNEFSMRAHYLVGAMQLDRWPSAEAAEYFARIASMKAVSVEDYSVQQLAILAQGRIWADAQDFIKARAAYSQVSLTGAYAEQATEELIQCMIYWAEILERAKPFLAKEALDSALKAMMRYRSIKEITWRTPKLQMQVARLLKKTKRYQEASKILSVLIEQYRRVYGQLQAGQAESKIWPFLALEDEKGPSEERDFFYLHLPKAFLQKLPDLHPVLALKGRIENGRAKLVMLIKQGQALPELIKLQQALESAYSQLARSVQENIKKDLAPLIIKTIAEAEFRQGEIAAQEMQDLRKQINVVGKFQTEKIMNFEKNVAEIGGSS